MRFLSPFWVLDYWECSMLKSMLVNSSLPGQDGHHFTDDIFRCIFINEKFCILIEISLKCVPKGPIDNNPALVQIMAWCRIGNKPLSEPMLTRFIDTYIYVTLGGDELTKFFNGFSYWLWRTSNVLTNCILYWRAAVPYRKTSNISCTLVGNKIVDQSDAVGTSPVGAAPTTSSFSPKHLASRDSAKTAARQYENLLSVGIWCVLY